MGVPVPYELLVQHPSTAALAGATSPPAFNELWWAVQLVVFVSILPQLLMVLTAVKQRTTTVERRSDISTKLVSSEQPTGVVVPVPVPTRDRIKLGD